MSEEPIELGYIHESLRPLARPVAELLPHPRNARRHPKRNIDEIESSLREHGQTRVAVVTNRPMLLAGSEQSPAGTLLIGNGMMRAATERLKWSHLAVIEFKGSEVEARKLALRDNRTSELAEWDYEPLGLELGELADLGVVLDDIGWTKDEAAPLLEADFDPGTPDVDADPSGIGGDAKPGIKLTAAQRQVVDAAIEACRARCSNNALTAAECLAIICKAYSDGG